MKMYEKVKRYYKLKEAKPQESKLNGKNDE